jgi:transketolase
VRNQFAQTFYRLAQTNSKLCLVVADISPAGSIEQFRQDFPDRFINTGVAEQVMIGMCAGMSQKGLRPFAYTIATFALYRPFEMIRDDLAYQNLPVTVVGIGGGVSYASLGGTHHAQEDVFIASSIPNMQVIVPCDPLETAAATEYCVSQNKGPVYMRLGRAGEPILTENSLEEFSFGKVRYLKKGEKTCILSYGAIMGLAFDLYEDYKIRGQNPSLVSVHTLKPLDRQGLSKILKAYEEIIVIEEISPEGYLASQLKKLAWEEKVSPRIYDFSLKDQFIHFYGKPHELLEAHGLSLNQIKSTIGV